MRVLLLDRDTARREEIAAKIRAALPDASLGFDYMEQREVFETPPSPDCAAVFLWIGGMLDMEAARQLSHASPQLPVVLYTDSRDYGMESYEVGARYCLLYPIKDAVLVQALERCGLINR